MRQRRSCGGRYAEELLESQPFENAIDDRQQADAVGVEVVADRFARWPTWVTGMESSGVFTDVAPDEFAGLPTSQSAALDRRVISGQRASIPADIIVRSEESSRGEGSRRNS